MGTALVPLSTPNHRVRHDGWTAPKQRGFIEALARFGNVRDACRAVGMSSQSAYRLRRIDPTFGAAWDAALRQASTSLEAVAFARAVDGVEEVVIRDGKEAWRRRRYSDSLLRLLLQGTNPDKYGRTARQPTVQAREEIEGRVQEIEQAAYRAAWHALTAEYAYLAESEHLRRYLFEKMSLMHSRMCQDPRCAECHPERVDHKAWPAAAGKVHQPIDGPANWLGAEADAWAPEDGEEDRPNPFLEEARVMLRQARLDADARGEQLALPNPRPPAETACYRSWSPPPAPPWAGSAIEGDGSGAADAGGTGAPGDRRDIDQGTRAVSESDRARIRRYIAGGAFGDE